jgi:hypothetical protein
MQELPESVQRMVGSVYLMLTKGGSKVPIEDLQNAIIGSEEAPVSY